SGRDPRQRDQSDVLRECGLSERAEERGDGRRQHVSSQAVGHSLRIHGRSDDLTDGDDVGCGFGLDDEDDDEHRQDRCDVERRHPERQNRRQSHRGRGPAVGEVGLAHERPIAVPRTRPMRMDRREIVADPTLLSRRMMPKVMKAKRMLLIEPYPAASSSPPIAQSAAVGMRVRPMEVITTPVTTGGKNRMILAKKGAMMKPMMLATMIEPKIELTVPPPCRMASMVATPANDTPWMSGSF